MQMRYHGVSAMRVRGISSLYSLGEGCISPCNYCGNKRKWDMYYLYVPLTILHAQDRVGFNSHNLSRELWLFPSSCTVSPYPTVHSAVVYIQQLAHTGSRYGRHRLYSTDTGTRYTND